MLSDDIILELGCNEILVEIREGDWNTERKSCEDRDGAWSDKPPTHPHPKERQGIPAVIRS